MKKSTGKEQFDSGMKGEQSHKRVEHMNSNEEGHDEYQAFSAAMHTILKANPILVKTMMKDEKQTRSMKKQAKVNSSAPSSSDRKG